MSTSLKLNADGLIPAIIQDATTGRVLMLGYMNEESLALTRQSGEVWFYSRSRQELWHKGQTSGNVLRVRELRADCDADAILVRAEPAGPTCHTGAESCFWQDTEGQTIVDPPAGGFLDELAGIEGFDEDLAQELQSRAQEALERREAAAREERRALGVEDALAELPYLTEAMLVTLGKAGIRTLDDLADLATDELVEKRRAEPRRRNEDAPKRPENKGGVLAEYGLSEEQGNEIIMAARAHWFEGEDGADQG